MELPKIKRFSLEKFGPLKFNNQFTTKDGLVLKSLQEENLFIKKKLFEFEEKLNTFSSVNLPKFNSNSAVNFENSNEEFNIPKIKLSRISSACDKNLKTPDYKPDRGDDTYNNNNNNDSNKKNEIFESKSLYFKPSYSDIEPNINSNLKSPSPVRNNSSLLNRIKSTSKIDLLKRKKYNAAADAYCSNTSRELDLKLRNSSARSIESFNSSNTGNSNERIQKFDEILDNLKKHRRSAARRSVIEKNEMLKPIISENEPEISRNLLKLDHDESNDVRASNDPKKSLNRSKSAVTDMKDIRNMYKHTFYSRSWRVHSEITKDDPVDNGRMNPTSSIFYIANRQLPETFIFHPDWI